MTTVVYNEDGTPIWVDAQEKLNAVKQALLPQLQDIKKKWDKNEISMYPRKLEFNSYINQLLVINFRKFPKVPSKYAVDVDIETLRDYVNCYFDLIEFILQYYQEFVSTKPLFCMFCGIEPYCYNQWLISQNPDILTEIQFVETHLEEITVLSAQTGKLKEKSSENRLKSNGIGHNLNLKTEEEKIPTINLVSFDVDSVSRQIANMGIKVIDKK
jgi:hypothetical protein